MELNERNLKKIINILTNPEYNANDIYTATDLGLLGSQAASLYYCGFLERQKEKQRTQYTDANGKTHFYSRYLYKINKDNNILNAIQSSKKEEQKKEDYKYYTRAHGFDTLRAVTTFIGDWAKRFNSLYNVYLDRQEKYIIIKRAECDE